MKFYEMVDYIKTNIKSIYDKEDFREKTKPEKDVLIKEAVQSLISKEKLTVNELSTEETFKEIIPYIIGNGVITELINQLNDNKTIDKAVLIGTTLTVFLPENKVIYELEHLNDSLVMSSICMLADTLHYVPIKFKTQIEDYLVECLNAYKPTIVIRRINEKLLVDNTLEYKLLSAFLDSNLIDSNGIKKAVRDLMPLSDEYFLKQQIGKILVDELAEIYNNK